MRQVYRLLQKCLAADTVIIGFRTQAVISIIIATLWLSKNRFSAASIQFIDLSRTGNFIITKTTKKLDIVRQRRQTDIDIIYTVPLSFDSFFTGGITAAGMQSVVLRRSRRITNATAAEGRGRAFNQFYYTNLCACGKAYTID
jgi:hypothetical protein